MNKEGANKLTSLDNEIQSYCTTIVTEHKTV